jgi:hypothetical protein
MDSDDTFVFVGSLVFSRIDAKLGIKRNERFYAVNVITVLFVITSLSITAFCVHPGGIPSRTGIDLTLLLTAVVFKFSVVSLLPAR